MKNPIKTNPIINFRPVYANRQLPIRIEIDSDLELHYKAKPLEDNVIAYHFNYKTKHIKIIVPIERNPKKMKLPNRIRTNALAQKTAREYFQINHYIPPIQLQLTYANKREEKERRIKNDKSE